MIEVIDLFIEVTSEGDQQVEPAECHIRSILHNVCTLIVKINRHVVAVTKTNELSRKYHSEGFNSRQNIRRNLDRVVDSVAFWQTCAAHAFDFIVKVRISILWLLIVEDI
jgi:hypothetical protein